MAFPGQDRLAALCGASTRQVQRALKELGERAHLSIEVRRGPIQSSRYAPLIRGENTTPVSRIEGANTRHPRRVSEGEKATSTVANTRRPCRPNPIREPIEKSAARCEQIEKLSGELFAIIPRGSTSRSNRRLFAESVDLILGEGVAPKSLELAVRKFVAESPDAKDQDGRFMGAAHKWLSEKRGWEAFLPNADELFLHGRPRDELIWFSRIRSFANVGRWDEREHGPKPGAEGCRAPPDMIAHVLASRPANDTVAILAPQTGRQSWC